MAGASRLVQSELLGSGHRTVPCSSQTTNLRSWKSKFNRLAGPALVAEAPPSSPRLLGTEESRDLISLVLGNHRTPFTFPHVTSPSPNFPPVYTVVFSLVAAATCTACFIIPHCYQSLSPGLSLLQVTNPQEIQTLFHYVPTCQSCCQAQPHTFPLPGVWFPNCSGGD